MKFLELQIKGFGKFHDRSIPFTDGINVVYGKNEAGKSTIHTFIRCMLFGLKPQRGKAARKDLYNQYEPWENSGTYEGALRLEHAGHIYRIERTFRKDRRELRVIDESLGKEMEATDAFMDELLGGLSETSYNNTISIGQLKCATDSGMVSELKNYIANMNTSGNMALNITKASAYLKAQRKELESRLVPEAARSYTALLGDIKAIENDIAAPEYENLLPAYTQLRQDTRAEIEEKQAEKEDMIQKAARGRQLLEENHFTDLASVEQYENQAEDLFREYRDVKTRSEKKSRKVMTALFFVLAALLAAGAIAAGVMGGRLAVQQDVVLSPLIAAAADAGIAAVVCCAAGIILLARTRKLNRELLSVSQKLRETFQRQIGDADLSEQTMDAFRARMAEFKRLVSATEQSEKAVTALSDELAALNAKQNNCSEEIEKQQKIQWDLEKKLELLSGYKNQLEALKHTLEENQQISQELEAIDLAQETMNDLSMSIRNSFGLYLNKTASDLVAGITGGVYSSMSIDENLNVFMNTRTRLVPIEQVSSGTMDQIYLALRLAAAKLIQGDKEEMPLVFDDSFVLYDDDRLRSALRWLAKSYGGQMIIFTCHQREAQMLTANQIAYNLIRI